MHLVTAQPVGGAELTDPSLDLALERLEPGEFVHPAGELLQVGDDQCAYRGISLRSGDPRVAVDVIRDGDRDVLHSFTVTQFLCGGTAGPLRAQSCRIGLPSGTGFPPVAIVAVLKYRYTPIAANTRTT